MTATTARVRGTRPTPAAPQTSSRLLAINLFVLGVGAGLVALLGPLGVSLIEYHVSAGAANQILGGDLAGLFLMGPASIVAGILVWRRHPAGAVMALGPGLYGLYMYSQLSLGGDIIRYPGNSERYFLLFVTLFVLAGAIVVGAWNLAREVGCPSPGQMVGRVAGAYFLIVAIFLALGLHLPGLLDAWSTQPTSSEYLADPNVFWLVKFMDLGLVVPGLVVAGVGAWRRTSRMRLVVCAAAGWAALLGSSVAGMAIVMQATGDPAGTTGNTIAFTLFAAIGLVVAWGVVRPVLVEPAPE